MGDAEVEIVDGGRPVVGRPAVAAEDHEPAHAGRTTASSAPSRSTAPLRRRPPRRTGRRGRSAAPGPRPSRCRASAGRRGCLLGACDGALGSVSSIRSSSEPPCAAREQAVGERRQRAAQVERAGRAGREADADGHGIRQIERASAAGRAPGWRARAGSSTRRRGFWLEHRREPGPRRAPSAGRGRRRSRSPCVGPGRSARSRRGSRPAPSRLILRPPRSIRTCPRATMKNSPPIAPSRVSTFPSETSTSSMSLPRNSISRRLRPEKSGTAAIRSSLGSVEGTA